MAKITLQNLRHSYMLRPERDEDWALKPMSLEWSDGGAYALLGPSGCGKTTLLNLISGLLHPSEGRILFDDQDVTTASPEARNIAQVFQFPVIYDTMSVYDNLAFPLRNRKMPPAQIARRVGEIAELLELSGQLGQRAAGLPAVAGTTACGTAAIGSSACWGKGSTQGSDSRPRPRASRRVLT